MPPPIRPFVPIALYEGALDALPAGVLVFHLDVPDDPGSLRLLYANPSASRVAGLDFAAHLGETLRDFLPGAMETDLPTQYADVALTGEEREIGDVAYGEDGVRPGIYNVRAFGLPDQSVGLLLEDVSEKRRLDAEREEEREFLGAVLENVSDGIVACNSGGELTLFNRATREFHGLPAEPIPAGTWAEHYSLHRADGSPMPTEEIPLLRALHGEVLRDEPMRIVPKDGTARTLLASGRPLAGAAGQPLGAVVAMRDVTANEQAQAEVLALVATQRELEEQARTLETINRVNASLAAELEPEGLVQAVTDAGTELTEAQFGAFFYNVVNRAGESYMLYTISGVPREAFSQFPMPRNTDVFHATFSGEGVVRLDDVTQDPRYGNNPPYHGMPAGHLPVRSYLAVPVKSSEGQVIGGLFFGHEEVGVFDERAEQLALALADQAAIALQNARLYAALQAELADRRQVESALRESESRYRALIQAAPDVVFAYTLDEDGRPGPFIEFNDAALRTYGYTREEAARLTPADLLAPEARGKIDGRLDRLRAEGQVLFETTHVTKNGREVPMEASAQLFQLEGRDAVLAVCRDVTDRRDAENAVRRALAHAEEAERQLLAVLDNLPELAWTAEPDGTIDFYNRRWYEYTGTAPGDMAGGGWHAVHDPAVLPGVLERWRHSVSTGEPFEMEYPLRGADGTYRWFLSRVQPLRDVDGKIVRWVGTNANIDEHRRLLAERDAVLERLAASERQFRLLTDAVPQLIWTSTAEGTPDFYNERWYSYTGMARPDASGAGLDTNWGDYVHPDERAGAFAAFGRAAAAGAPFEYEYRFRSHDGSYRWFLGRALPTLDDEGQVTGWVGSATDIQEMREVREALVANEALFRGVFEQAGVGVVVVDPDTGVFHRVNARFSEIAGRTADELRGLSLFDLIHPEDRERDRGLFARMARGEVASVSTQKRYLHPDGEIRWVKVDARLLPGTPARSVNVVQDVTEERRAEEALRASEARYSFLGETLAQQIWTAGPDGALDYVNRHVTDYFGHTAEQVLGEGWTGVVHPDDLAAVGRRWAEALATGEPYEVEFRLRRADGAYRWHLGRAHALRDDGGAVVKWFGTNTDIHERKVFEQELEVRVAERTAEAQSAAERLDAVLNGTTDLIAAVDTEYRVLAFNQGFSAAVEAIIGKPLALGMRAEDLLPDQPEEWARSKADWTRVLAGESYTKLERQEYPGLGFRAFESYFSPIRSGDGAVTGGVCVVRDVTDRERSTQAVEAFAKDLRALHAVVTADHETTAELLQDYLRAGSTLFDLPHGIISETPRDAETGRRVYRIRAVVSPDPAFQAGATLPLSATFCDRVVDEGATVAFADAAEAAPTNPACAERGLHAFIGTPIYVGDELVGTLNFSGPDPRAEPFAPHEVELIELMAEFVGRQLAVEQARHAERQAEARYRTLVEALDEGVVLQDAAGTAVAWNEAAMRVLGSAGYGTPGAAGLGPVRTAIRVDGTAFPTTDYPAAVALRTGEPQRNVLMGVHGRGGDLRWLSVNAVPLREGGERDGGGPGGDGATTGVVTSFMDVTPLKQAEEALHRRGAELEERNADLEQFAYVASHDLQEPLRTVSSFLQLLERRYTDELDDRAREYIGFAVDASRRMQALIQGLLTYSRIGTRGRPFEPVDANVVLRDVLVDLGPALGDAEADVRAGSLPTLCADPTQLHQLLLNLVSNAIKFHREGVPPRVEVSAREVRDGGAVSWVFSVTDNGIGLEQKYADRVFQLFQRLHTRDEFPGTGIGLAVCKKIVERHGGALAYSDSPGGGTTFSFTLPIRPLDGCDGPPEPAGRAPAPAE